MTDLNVGVHVSIAGSIERSIGRALNLGCTTFQIFTRNPRGWAFSDLSGESASLFSSQLSRSKISPVVDHMPYLPNLASPSDEIHSKSVHTLKAEILRCDLLGIPFLVTHLGSHMGAGEMAGRARIVSALDSALELNAKCMILLENTAGQKNSLGAKFDDLCNLIYKTRSPERIGICFDTCHAFAAGYDVRTEMGSILDELDASIGIGKLKVVHLNDTLGDLNSHLDRHEHIGLGKIGESGFISILSDRRIHAIPLIMETPVDERRDDKGNMTKIRDIAQKIA